MTTTQGSSRFLIGRITDGRITVLGAGIAVAPQIVMTPMSMSGPLRPREGVVVLPTPDAHPFEAHPVERILPCAPSAGDVLGLKLTAKLGDFQEPPPHIPMQQWLLDRLQGGETPTDPAHSWPDGGKAPKVTTDLRRLNGAGGSARRRSRSRVCVIFPRLCG